MFIYPQVHDLEFHAVKPIQFVSYSPPKRFFLCLSRTERFAKHKAYNIKFY